MMIYYNRTELPQTVSGSFVLKTLIYMRAKDTVKIRCMYTVNVVNLDNEPHSVLF